MEEKKHDNKTAHQQAKPSVKREEAGWGWRMAVNLCRLPLSLALIFSGFVKAIDPLGTQYKIGDYLEALHLEQYAPPGPRSPRASCSPPWSSASASSCSLPSEGER